MGYIYCIENLINHKRYIGQTTQTIEKRFYAHCHSNDHTVLHNAIRSYGVDNFKVFCLEECPNEELNDKERMYIQKYNTHWRDGEGYNMSYGGENSPDVLEKPIAVYPIDENFEPIINQREIFKSISEATRALEKRTNKKFFTGGISLICNGKKYSTKGYTFCFIDENKNDIPTGYNGIKGSSNASKENIKKCHQAAALAIVITDDDGNEYLFASRSDASKALHIDAKTINKILSNPDNRPIKSGPHKGWRIREANESDFNEQNNFQFKPYFTEKESNKYFSDMMSLLEDLDISLIDDNGLRPFSEILTDISEIYNMEEDNG